jgi:hypothetical protein
VSGFARSAVSQFDELSQVRQKMPVFLIMLGAGIVLMMMALTFLPMYVLLTAVYTIFDLG